SAAGPPHTKPKRRSSSSGSHATSVTSSSSSTRTRAFTGTFQSHRGTSPPLPLRRGTASDQYDVSQWPITNPRSSSRSRRMLVGNVATSAVQDDFALRRGPDIEVGRFLDGPLVVGLRRARRAAEHGLRRDAEIRQ